MSPLAVSNWQVCGFVVIPLVVLSFYGYAFYLLNHRLRANGYPTPFTWLSLTAAYLIMLAGTGFGIYFFSRLCWSCTPAANPEVFRPEYIWPNLARFAGSVLLGSIPFSAVTIMVCLLLPKRQRRPGQRRARFPWKLVSKVFLLCLLATPLAVYLCVPGGFGEWFRITFRFGVLLLGVHRWTAYMAKRLAAPGIDQSLENDARAPVLYMREFAREDKPFTALSYDDCQRLGVPMLNAQSFRHPATLEQYFDSTIRQKIGPFVALGNPDDYAPPGGASRDYRADEDWIGAFRDLATRSACIVMNAGGSANLQLELTLLREMDFTRKLFVVTRPKPKRRILPESWAIASENKKWSEFVRRFIAAGLGPSEYPGLGAIVTFENNGAAVLGSGCTTPEQYVDAIEQRLASLQAQSSADAATAS